MLAQAAAAKVFFVFLAVAADELAAWRCWRGFGESRQIPLGFLQVFHFEAEMVESFAQAAIEAFVAAAEQELHLAVGAVLVEVVEKDVPLVKIGQKAELRSEAYPDQVFEGTVTRIVQALNRATRTMTVEIDLPNPDRRLKGGMFARVEILVGTHRQALQIPIDAVSRLEDTQYVYIVQEGKARRINIDIGARRDNHVEITNGLTGGEQVIVSGKDLVHDGTPVQVELLPKS